MKALSTLAVAALMGLAHGEENSDVVTITNDNFREEIVEYEGLALVEFYAPWCGHCKALAPEWAKAATALKGKPVKIAACDATEFGETSKMFDVSGFPTIIQFNYGKKEDEEGIIYTDFSARDADTIIDLVADTLSKEGIDISQVNELVSNEEVEACLAKKYCGIFSLPHVVETGAAGRNEYIEIIKEVIRSLGRSNPASFLWVQGGNQPAFEDAFGASSYPGLTLINHERTRYVTHVGGFNAAALTKTVRALQSGRKTATTYKTFPKIEKTDSWDGKDYVYEEEEDEY